MQFDIVTCQRAHAFLHIDLGRYYGTALWDIEWMMKFPL